ncbi:5226_t:CDS:2 [Dentiscutata erythropus]|uniref:5226_t:CDS:1 n=1 Tax=Dentiscutata erythropus TaxID=1348616 RepID=A0A9N9GQI6_9GLOM|nr:5226_t:CDS:2 [Dentiscutata erythropus]
MVQAYVNDPVTFRQDGQLKNGKVISEPTQTNQQYVIEENSTQTRYSNGISNQLVLYLVYYLLFFVSYVFSACDYTTTCKCPSFATAGQYCGGASGMIGCNSTHLYECNNGGTMVCDYGVSDSCNSQPTCNTAVVKRDGQYSSCGCKSCTFTNPLNLCNNCDCNGCFASASCQRCSCPSCFKGTLYYYCSDCTCGGCGPIQKKN